MAIPGGMMDRVIQARKQQPGYNPNILGPFGQLITGVGNLLQGKPYQTSFTGVGNIPPSARGESYRRAELRLADAARSGGGGGGGNAGYSVTGFTPVGISPAAERAYQAEKSRVAQITAQDPELQRYEAARKIAAAPGATPEQVQSAEDIGMQMWAKANPQLAAKVKPGQSGYDAIQGSLAGQAASQGYGYQMPQQIMMTPPPGVNAPQGLPAVSSFGAASTYGQQGLQIDPEMEKKFQALLNQAQK